MIGTRPGPFRVPPAVLYCVFVLAAMLGISCSSHLALSPADPCWVDADQKAFPEPAPRDLSLAWQWVDRTAITQIEELTDLDRDILKIAGSPRQALNVNSIDEVPNSAWFTNRHGLRRMTPTEIERGEHITEGPDTTGEWIVVRAKSGGATPGFWIEDGRRNRYIIKFDPPEHPEMATAAEVMGSRFFYACGYNVPQSTIVYWRPENLRIKEGLQFKDAQGARRAFTASDLAEILSRAHRGADGRYRSSAALLLQNTKGPFSYSGRRRDDPNDWCPHEHRRELRGLYVLASLVNHYDAKDLNTLDVFVGEGGLGHLKHYLVDFGSTFGSNGASAKHPRLGYANMFDARDAFVSLVTLGLKTWAWEDARTPRYPSIGYFESELFRPDKFDPILPNPAFENLTDRDAYWGAKIAMAFRDDDLRALVRAGRLSDPDAEAYLLRTLIERRDKIGRHWFEKVPPLDRFAVEDSTQTPSIRFEDLAVTYGLADPGLSTYSFRVHHRGRTLVDDRDLPGPRIELSGADMERIESACAAAPDKDLEHLVEVDIRLQRGENRKSRPTRLWLWYHPDLRRLQLVAVEHPD